VHGVLLFALKDVADGLRVSLASASGGNTSGIKFSGYLYQRYCVGILASQMKGTLDAN
jgi:hypothetical protein